MLTPSELDLLTEFFDSDAAGEDALDFVATQGFVTAQVISPDPLPTADWLAVLLGDTPPALEPAQHEALSSALAHLAQVIDRGFQESDEDAYSLPLALELGDDPDESELRSWCVGFVLGQMEREDAWFAQDEQFVSELLLPLLVLSGLFREEPDIREMEADAELVDDMCLQLPDVLTELYLHFQAPEEKSAPKTAKTPPKKGGAGAKGRQGYPGNKKQNKKPEGQKRR